MLRVSLVLAVALATGACTTVRIQGPTKDEYEVKQRFGIVTVELKPSARAVVVDSTGIGVINALEGLTVGYHNSSYAVLPGGDCRIVLWIRTDEQLKELNQLLRERADICVLPAKPLTWEKP